MGYFWGNRKGRAKRELKAQTEQALSGLTTPVITGAAAPIFSPMARAYSSVSVATMIPSVAAYTTSLDEPAPPVLQDMGLAIEPIVALRAFYVEYETMEILSFNNIVWPKREPLEAHCSTDLFASHDAPYEGCSCGIYAWKHEGYDNSALGPISGDVYLWGDVLICDQGYRAEMAYPKSLIIKAEVATRVLKRLRDGLEDAYGVPVELHLGT